MGPHISRRAIVSGAGAALAGVALAGCSTYGGSSGQPAPDTQATGGPVAKTADIPVGGGKLVSNGKVVVTQPRAGTFTAFSAICTHQGCAVSEIKDGTINCPCHGSRFAVADGSVANGPATEPLPAVKITVNGDSIALG
ncbi:MAG TPA: Rieske (2Fe-2S) protein [Micromonosporaceae bacterium]|jgi:Rieske Fe-S protein|nr:Rieske (2Fe-2S) protein [Micromonosporaceae bacterium]